MADLSFSDAVVIQGLEIVNAPVGVDLDSCAGTIWLEDLDVVADSIPTNQSRGLRAVLCDDVLAVDCRITGSYTPSGRGVLAVEARDSALTLYDADLASITPGDTSGGEPRAGLELIGSIAFVGASTIRGAAATNAQLGLVGDCIPGLPAGPGILAREGEFIPSELTLQATVAEGGAAGGAQPFCRPAPAGPPLLLAPSTLLTELPVNLPPRAHDSTNVVGPAEPIELAFFGTPGELLITILGFAPQPVFDPLFGGVLGSFTNQIVAVTGFLDPSGVLIESLQLPEPLPVPELQVYSQGLLFSAEDGAVLTAPRVCTALSIPVPGS